MRIVLCAPCSDATILAERIRTSTHEQKIYIDQCYTLEALQIMGNLSCYDTVFVAFDGIQGLAVVSDIIEANPNTQIIWMSDDKQFSTIAYDLGISAFILKACTDIEIGEALEEVILRKLG